MGRAATVLLLPLLVAWWPASAHGQDSARARRRFEQGVRLLEDARFGEAAAALEESLAIRESPPALFNLGLAYRGMGSYRRAIATFQRFMDASGDRHGQMIRDARDFTREMTAALAHVQLTVRGGATDVTADGERVGSADGRLSVEVDPGRRVFVASRRGYRPARAEVELASGAHSELTLDASEHPLPGHLTVEAGTPSAEIRLDGRFVGRGRYAGPVAPGRHRIDLVAPGYGPQHRALEVRPGGSDRLALRLVVVERSTSVFGRWWFWTGAAAIAAGVVVTAILLTPPRKEPYYDGELGFTVEALSRSGGPGWWP